MRVREVRSLIVALVVLCSASVAFGALVSFKAAKDDPDNQFHDDAVCFCTEVDCLSEEYKKRGSELKNSVPARVYFGLPEDFEPGFTKLYGGDSQKGKEKARSTTAFWLESSGGGSMLAVNVLGSHWVNDDLKKGAVLEEIVHSLPSLFEFLDPMHSTGTEAQALVSYDEMYANGIVAGEASGRLTANPNDYGAAIQLQEAMRDARKYTKKACEQILSSSSWSTWSLTPIAIKVCKCLLKNYWDGWNAMLKTAGVLEVPKPE